MIGIAPIEAYIYSTGQFSILSNYCSIIFQAKIRMFISADKLFFKDDFYSIGFDFPWANHCVFVNAKIGVMEVVSAQHLKEEVTADSSDHG
jgi:hypothetical protein